jgi:hypothetical protein
MLITDSYRLGKSKINERIDLNINKKFWEELIAYFP